MSKKVIVGYIVNRDFDIFGEIKRFSKLYYGVKFVNLVKSGSSFSIKYFKKKIRKYQFSFFIIKLYSEESNKKIYDVLSSYAHNIPRLNSLRSVRTCESRKETFHLIEQKCKKLNVPKSFYSLNAAYEAVSNGIPIIIKLDTHNIRNLSKYDRIVGVARSSNEFLKIIRDYNIENNSLFFHEYLGKIDFVYKVYVINRHVRTIISQNLLRHDKIISQELVHTQVSIDKDFKRRILRLGTKFRMAIFGVDYILKDGVPYIVDINDFPSFSNIPEAISLISEYIYNFIDARRNLTKIPMRLKVKTYMA